MAPRSEGESAADFYRGKTVTVVVGFAPGGGFDTISRHLANHMGKHIPGEPTLIVENMDGAGSLIAANHLYSVAKPDGLTFGVFNEAQIVNQAIGGEGIAFDARKFGWLGNVQKNSTGCTIRTDSPYNTAQDLTRRDLPPLVLGGTGPGAATDDFPKLLRNVLGANIRLVSGYAGTAPIRLAVESREVDGLCWAWDSVEGTARHWLESNFVKVPIYWGLDRDERIESRFPTALRTVDIATDDQSNRLVNAGMAGGAIAKGYVTPPGVPAARLRALQDAFNATMTDPGFVADMESARLEINASPAAKTEQIVNEIIGLTPELAKRLAETIRN
jgi:tripartite-type tricarboxylate transporter receptor subunit TctC